MLRLLIVTFGILLFSGTAITGEDSQVSKNPQLSGDEVKALFTDRTQYCLQEGKDKTCKTYNAPDGKVTRIMDADGARREGIWWVNEEQAYCVRWDGKTKDLCFAVFKQDDGTYHLWKGGKHKATITKFMDGNVEKM